MFPPMGLSYLLPQLSNLGSPGLALREEVVAGLPLSPPAPPALVIICLPDLVLKVGSYRCMAQEQLVVPAGNVLGGSSQEFAPDTPAKAVCVVLYILTRYMRPEGPWQRQAAALADSSAFLTPLHDQKPIPNHSGSYWGILISYPLICLTK